MNNQMTDHYAYLHGNSAEPLWVHTFSTGKDSYFTNAFVLETAEGLIVMDALMTVSDASRINAFAQTTGKNILAIVITHPHPDHYAGAGVLQSSYPEAAIISTRNVKKEIQRIDPLLDSAFADKYGEDWPEYRPLPNSIVTDGENVGIANLQFQVHEFGCGESDWDTVWILQASTPIAFVGDMVFGEMHSYMADGFTQKWLDSLEALSTTLPSGTHIYTGHGASGEGQSLIKKQLAYIHKYRDSVAELLSQSGQLTQESKDRLVDRMKEVLNTDNLSEFIAAGSDAVASEICTEREVKQYSV